MGNHKWLILILKRSHFWPPNLVKNGFGLAGLLVIAGLLAIAGLLVMTPSENSSESCSESTIEKSTESSSESASEMLRGCSVDAQWTCVDAQWTLSECSVDALWISAPLHPPDLLSRCAWLYE